MEYVVLGWPSDGPTLRLDYRQFAYAGKFVMSNTGKAVAYEGAPASERDDCLVAADDGVVHRYDGRTWTPDRLFDDELTGIARDGEYAVTCGEDAVFERSVPDADWERRTFENDAFEGVDSRGGRAVAVGEDGVVVSR